MAGSAVEFALVLAVGWVTGRATGLYEKPAPFIPQVFY